MRFWRGAPRALCKMITICVQAPESRFHSLLRWKELWEPITNRLLKCHAQVCFPITWECSRGILSQTMLMNICKEETFFSFVTRKWFDPYKSQYFSLIIEKLPILLYLEVSEVANQPNMFNFTFRGYSRNFRITSWFFLFFLIQLLFVWLPFVFQFLYIPRYGILRRLIFILVFQRKCFSKYLGESCKWIRLTPILKHLKLYFFAKNGLRVSETDQ